MNILLGITGSVAATLTPKMVKALQEVGNVRVVATTPAMYFLNSKELMDMGVKIYVDDSEWYCEGDSLKKRWEKKGGWCISHRSFDRQYNGQDG